jgi:hypothetical protein
MKIIITESRLKTLINNINESDDYMGARRSLINDLKKENNQIEGIINQYNEKILNNNRIIKFYSNIINPNVSISEVKVNNYYVIKGGYQIFDPDGVKHRFSVFVGKKDDFQLGKYDERAKEIAKEKIIKLLEKKFPSLI